MKQFFWDLIHLTRGEWVTKYWWLWLSFMLILAVLMFSRKKYKKGSYEDFMKKVFGGKL